MPRIPLRKCRCIELGAARARCSTGKEAPHNDKERLSREAETAGPNAAGHAGQALVLQHREELPVIRKIIAHLPQADESTSARNMAAGVLVLCQNSARFSYVLSAKALNRRGGGNRVGWECNDQAMMSE